MDKRKEANLRVKANITDALFSLMHQKRFSDITVTEIMKEVNQFHESVAGTMPASSVDKYKLYLYMGALFNTAIVWLQNGTEEEAEEVAAAFCRFIGIPEEGTDKR